MGVTENASAHVCLFSNYYNLYLTAFAFLLLCGSPIEPVAYTVPPSTLQENQNCLVFFCFIRKWF